ncbi:MAG: M4 family metallopeptidase [Candidatus Melainabacteria bacterium]|nr:M4 family metallopeptidase [Candidatus Melainabacteria bacterium]
MGNEQGDAGAKPAVNNVEKLNQILEANQFVRIDLREKFMADAMAPSPDSLGERLWTVTKEGAKQIPEGFKNSLDPQNILPNVAIGFGIGAGMKAVLPEGGPVAKAAGGALGLYFVGKPLLESYYMAATANTQIDMYHASTHLGDAVGGMPVAMVEGAVGAKIGTAAVGRAMRLSVAEPLVNFKARQYGKLDAHLDGANAALRNVAFRQMGIGGPVMRMPEGHYSGVVPPYLLETLAKNTKDPIYLETIRKTEALALTGQRGNIGSSSVARVDHKGAREVYDAKGKEVAGELARSENQGKTGIAEVDNVFDYTGDVRSYYRDVHGRNSIDGMGMKHKSTVNFGDMENAYWDGSAMTYGKPNAKSPFKTFVLRDITGHEIAHGVTEFEAKTVYRNQPGALNEHYSDVFGALVDQRALGHSAKEASWLVGDGIWKEGVNGRALRDMKNPGTAYNDKIVGKDPQPAHMNEFIKTRSDNGGVHLNSGIPNKAFADFAQAVGGNAYDIPGKIWYEARAKAGATPSFAQFAFETVEAAKRLGYTEQVPMLQKAWDGVGVKPSKTDTGVKEVPILVGQTPDRVFPK